MTNDQLKDKHSTENEKYLAQLKLANAMVSECLSKNNCDFDKHDLFRIAMNSFKTPEEKLSTGIRRRIISGI